MEALLEVIFGFLAVLFPIRIPMRGTDRRLLSESRVHSTLSAETGGVLNMVTEGSTGLCEVSPGHLRFIPRIGIVGNREIDVVGLRSADAVSAAEVMVDWDISRNLAISTMSGELLWIVPDYVADEVIARLTPPAK
jgi:hypothetical protein